MVLRGEVLADGIFFRFPQNDGLKEALLKAMGQCGRTANSYALVSIQPPKRPRSTGKGSANHHLNGHIMQICAETGNDFEAVKYCVKMLAVEEMGYPYKEIDGHIWPQSEADASSGECAILIDAAHVWAATHGIVLREAE